MSEDAISQQRHRRVIESHGYEKRDVIVRIKDEIELQHGMMVMMFLNIVFFNIAIVAFILAIIY